MLRNDWKGPGRPSDVQALERVLEIGNGIHHSLQLTGDSPSLHDNGKMPTLDLGIWTDRREVSREETRSIVMHEFYAKEVSAKHVTHARSAMPAIMYTRITPSNAKMQPPPGVVESHRTPEWHDETSTVLRV